MVASAGYAGPSVHTNYLLWVIVGLSVTGVFILCFFFYDKRQKTKSISPDRSSGKAEGEGQGGSPAEGER